MRLNETADAATEVTGEVRKLVAEGAAMLAQTGAEFRTIMAETRSEVLDLAEGTSDEMRHAAQAAALAFGAVVLVAIVALGMAAVALSRTR